MQDLDHEQHHATTLAQAPGLPEEFRLEARGSFPLVLNTPQAPNNKCSSYIKYTYIYMYIYYSLSCIWSIIRGLGVFR